MRLISHGFVGFMRGKYVPDISFFKRISGLVFLLLVNQTALAETPDQNGEIRFTPMLMMQWPTKEFEGFTDYQLAKDADSPAIKAVSRGAASGLFYETEIDLNKTPYLSWRWKVTRLPDLDNERIKIGDDFAARVYVVVNDGWTFLSTKAISYVWSAQSPAGEEWPNPFAGGSAMMVSVRHQPAGDGWYTEKRNLKSDLKRLFGKEITTIKAIAIMTDTDNSGSQAEAFYGDLVFSAD